MAVSPPRGPGFSNEASLQGQLAEQRKNRAKIKEAEATLNNEVKRIQDATKTVQVEGDMTLDMMSENYQKQIIENENRQTNALLQEKAKQEDVIVDLRNKQNAEIARLRRDGEQQNEKLKAYYDNQAYSIVREGEKNLQQKMSEAHIASETQRREGEFREKELKTTQQQYASHLQAQNELNRKLMDQEAQKELERLKGNYSGQSKMVKEKFDQRYTDTVQAHDASLNIVNQKAAQELAALTKDASRKLSAYSERSNDPFYSIIDIGAKMEESPEGYQITAVIPRHEQKDVSVSVQRDRIVLTGRRSNNERVETEPGRFKSTTSYQTFNESFPIKYQVDERGLTKQFDGDQLSIFLPKRGVVLESQPHEKPMPARIRAARPQFPGNLPLPQDPKKDPVV